MKPALFWDFDGTLVSSPHLWSGSLLKALQAAWPGCPLTLDDIRPHLRSGFPWHTPEADFTRVTGEAWWAHMDRHFEKVCMALHAPGGAVRTVPRIIRNMILDPGQYVLYEDTVSVLARCGKMGFSQYILSNNHPDLGRLLDALGLAPYFADTIVSGIIGFDKPRKEIFQYALEMAGNPGFCFMVGDNPYADGEGAKNAGIPALMVHTKTPAPSFPCFETLKDAADYIQEALYAFAGNDHCGL